MTRGRTTTRRRSRVFARGYSVFNAAQVDGYAAPALPVLPEAERIDHAEAFFAAIGADIRHGGARACYVPSLDQIRMPPFEAFRDFVAYYATLAHEATHFTGHPSRCARDLRGGFGDEAYAAEELVAELGAAFVCADLALAPEPRPGSCRLCRVMAEGAAERQAGDLHRCRQGAAGSGLDARAARCGGPSARWAEPGSVTNKGRLAPSLLRQHNRAPKIRRPLRGTE